MIEAMEQFAIQPMPGGSIQLAFGMPGGMEWIILLVLGLLIFGRRLPEVGRSLGKGIVEFKRGIKGIEDEIDDNSSKPAPAIDAKRSAELADQTEPASPATDATSPITDASVGGEAANPYRPADKSDG